MICSKCRSSGVIITCISRGRHGSSLACLHFSEHGDGKDVPKKSVFNFYFLTPYCSQRNLSKLTSITELSYLSADENNGINCDFPEREGRKRGGPNLPPPVFCISCSFLLGFIPSVLFRLHNIRHCCAIFPIFSTSHPLELSPPALSAFASRTPPPLFSCASSPLSFSLQRASANGTHASQGPSVYARLRRKIS